MPCESSVWVGLVTGLLFFLDEFTPLKWGHSWPLFIILAGVMTVLQRTVVLLRCRSRTALHSLAMFLDTPRSLRLRLRQSRSRHTPASVSTGSRRTKSFPRTATFTNDQEGR